jgi:NAD(P)-dependent dehydrogenase (short-subunit alcohol dehydrogenase family)
MNMDFSTRVVIVTGGTSGIGRATAEAFAAAGARVVIGARRVTLGQQLVERIVAAGGEASFVRTDVTVRTEVASLVTHALDRHGRLDYAFNNAGIAGEAFKPTAQQSEASWDAVLSTNLKGVWNCMQYEIPAMLRSGGGAIVNNASDVGLAGSEIGIAPYVASKHGVVGLTRSAAIEYARQGIRVNAVCPGFTHSEMSEPAVRQARDEIHEYIDARVPMGRIADAREVAEAVLWLCSDASSFVTGHALPIEGGVLAR